MFSIDHDCKQADKDIAIANLWEAGCTGIIEVADSAETARLRAFFDDDTRQTELLAQFPGEVTPADLRDWVAFAHEFLQPMEIGQRIFVCPEWRNDPTPPGRIRIEVNAGLAFGTGAHETTRLCLEALERNLKPGMTVLDVGTGSGILAEAAVKLGAARVHASDTDQEAVDVARENFLRAGVDVELSTGSAPDFPDAIADIVLANISPAWISDLAPDWVRVLKPGGTAILSGFEATDISRVTTALEAAGARISGTFGEKEWRMMETFGTHHYIQTNGIRMHYVEAGSGPLVVLLHGFPECSLAWRHQINCIARAGYRVVAPDLRGYGQTESPEALEAFDIFQLTGDIVGLVKALEESSAVIVGHDWGALITSYLSLFRPDLFRATVLLSVPYPPRREISPTQWERETYPGKVFYQANLRASGAEQFLQRDIRDGLLRGLYSLSGEAAPEERFLPAREPGRSPAPAKKPSFITDEEVDAIAAQFEHSGYRGGLNYYRNMDRNWAQTPFLAGAKILQPTLFVAGALDPVIEFLRAEYDALETNVPNLRKKILIEGAGHWIQQERPREVNQAIIEFLKSL